MKYDDIRDKLNVGDIVLFSGNSGFSRIIRHFCRSDFSHVGIVWRIDQWDLNMLWESTTQGKIPDVFDLTIKQGVQTVALSQKIARYDGEVTIRRLNKPLTDDMIRAMTDFRRVVKNRPYEENKWNLAKAVLDRSSDNDEDLSSLFCSELVAETYQRMGLLSEDTPSSEYIPHDFSSAKMKKLLQGYKLLDEIKLEK